jgi:glycosyltransferase involved in cell wall biosynthesis
MRAGLIVYGDIEAVSGGNLYDRRLVEYLRQQGDQVDIVSLPQCCYLRHIGDNLSERLLRRLSEGQWDILLQDELTHPSLFILNGFIKKRTRYPLVSIVHHLRSCEPFPAWQRRIFRSVETQYLASVDGCICNSRTTRSVVKAILRYTVPSLVAFPGKDRERVRGTEEDIRQRVQDASPLKIAFLGNVIRRKGLHVLLNALTALRELPWQLDIIGDLSLDRGYVNNLLSTIVSRRLVDRVSLYGMLSDDEIHAFLKKVHVLVVPSLYEGLGIAYMEALSYGVPVVGTSAGGAPEIISHGGNGYLVKAGDAAALARVLLPLCRDRELLYSLSLNALHSLRHFPEWEESMGAIREFLLKDVLKQPVLSRRQPHKIHEEVLAR